MCCNEHHGWRNLPHQQDLSVSHKNCFFFSSYYYYYYYSICTYSSALAACSAASSCSAQVPPTSLSAVILSGSCLHILRDTQQHTIIICHHRCHQQHCNHHQCKASAVRTYTLPGRRVFWLGLVLDWGKLGVGDNMLNVTSAVTISPNLCPTVQLMWT